MAEALDLNLRGLIHVLAAVLIREIARESAEASEKTEKNPDEDDQK